MLRTQFYADPQNLFLHDLVLDSCRRHGNKTAIFDISCNRRLSYSEYGETVEQLAGGMITAGLKPGEVVAIFLANSWEFCAAFHATQLAGAIPTLLNPTYREREVRYQLENSGAAFLITDGSHVDGINLSGLPSLRRVYHTRQPASGAEAFSALLNPVSASFPKAEQSSAQALAALPYSSGTTGLPKGVMLSHLNLVANIYQLLGPRTAELNASDTILCCLPLYHIYGLNVMLNPSLILGSTLILSPRFQLDKLTRLIIDEGVTMMPLVPPAVNAICQAAEAGQFPHDHKVRWVKSGAAPLAPDLPRRFTELTNILVCQGYGMTEASPVTHVGYLDPALYHPDSIGHPVVQTDCRVLSQSDLGPTDTLDDLTEAPSGQPGELVMRGPQFMLGYWKAPEATEAVLRDGWYWSGDIVTRDREGFYRVVDRRKEMIKYKGFAIAPAEVEAVLLEHPAVKECGVVGRACPEAGEIPVAFVSLRDGFSDSGKLKDELRGFVADRLTHFKQPREVRFIDSVPKTASGKVLRRELRKQMA
ncbi:MAG TPA: class I adenylate-forming enzyme family protein [Candidatus Sulfotelmatobacter sp.]|jgi:acyl-CoA synthetase (AMP-forming)/AMP-acid ligase II|nr:class I adenylate-forming enzyme family protein [Candidatus Sulfotelmatobacter sp.]